MPVGNMNTSRVPFSGGGETEPSWILILTCCLPHVVLSNKNLYKLTCGVCKLNGRTELYACILCIHASDEIRHCMHLH